MNQDKRTPRILYHPPDVQYWRQTVNKVKGFGAVAKATEEEEIKAVDGVGDSAVRQLFEESKSVSAPRKEITPPPDTVVGASKELFKGRKKRNNKLKDALS